MSSTPEQKFNVTEHDWSDATYVDSWIARDRTRDDRLPVLKEMVTFAPYKADAEISVLDVGAGYGAVAAPVLERFPRAKVTLHDYSQVMLDRAKAELPQYASRLQFRQSDLTDPGWTKDLGGLVQISPSPDCDPQSSSTTLQIAAVYKAVYDKLKPGGAFLDCDHFMRIGGSAVHIDLCEESRLQERRERSGKKTTTPPS